MPVLCLHLVNGSIWTAGKSLRIKRDKRLKVCPCCRRMRGQAAFKWCFLVLRTVDLWQPGLLHPLDLCTGGQAEVQSLLWCLWCWANLDFPFWLCFNKTASLMLCLYIHSSSVSIGMASQQILGTCKWQCSLILHKPSSYCLLRGEFEWVRNFLGE